MISIIIPIYDIKAHLKSFINSISKLESQLRSENKNILKEVILINNNPKTNLGGEIKKIATVSIPLRIIQNKKNVGYGAACNMGMKAAKGKYVLIMNPDVEIDAKALEGLMAFMIKNNYVNIASCKLVNSDGSLQNSCRRFPTIRALLGRRIPLPFGYIFKKQLDSYEMNDYDHESPRKVDWVSGALMLIRGRHHFDERYFMYFEDIDLCRAVGGVYYYPRVSAVHKAERKSAKSLKLLILHVISMIKYFIKFRNT